MEKEPQDRKCWAQEPQASRSVRPSREKARVLLLKYRCRPHLDQPSPSPLLLGWPGRPAGSRQHQDARHPECSSPGGSFYRVLAAYTSSCNRAPNLGKSEFCLCGPGRQTRTGSRVLRVSWHQFPHVLVCFLCQSASFNTGNEPFPLPFPSPSHPPPTRTLAG